ncbi:putative polyphosphoinositide phosphatase-like protein, partial [Tanacetum coccineum]
MFTKGDLLTKTRKLVNGLAKEKPVWLKAMEMSPPSVFPRAEKKVERICLPEDVYINKFYKKHPESLHEDPIKISDLDPTPSRIFGQRVLELKEQGVKEQDAIDVADTEYQLQKKSKKKAYKRLKEIAKLRG